MQGEGVSIKLTDVQQAYCFERVFSSSANSSANVLYDISVSSNGAEDIVGCWKSIVNNYDVLQTSLLAAGTQVSCLNDSFYHVEFHDLSADSGYVDQFVSELKGRLINKIFPLGVGPHYSLDIVVLSDDSIRVFALFDMALADVNSIQIVVNDFMSLLSSGEQKSKKYKNGYYDYRGLLDARINDDYILAAKKYWSDKFESTPSCRGLNFRATNTNNVPMHSMLSGWSALARNCQEHSISPECVMLAIYSRILFLSCYKNPLTIVVVGWNNGVDPDSFSQENVDGIIGDTTALHWVVIDKDYTSIIDLAKDVEAQLNQDREYSLYSGINELRKISNSSKNQKAFPFVFTTPLDTVVRPQTNNVQLNRVESTTPGVKMDCTAYEMDGNLHVQWDTDSSFISSTTAGFLFQEYVQALSLLSDVKNWSTDLDELLQGLVRELSSPSDLCFDKGMSYLSGQKVDYGSDTTIVSLFKDAVERHGNKTAVMYEGETLDFKTLDEYSTRVAIALKEIGVQRGDVVALMLDRSLHMMVALVGILKSGAAYLPIDTTHPKDRIRYILDDSSAKCLVTIPDFADFVCVDDLDTEFVDIQNAISEINKDSIASEAGFTESVLPDDLAYIIYTSGSTGHPKGCMLEHKSAVNRLLWMADEYDIGPDDIILQKTPYTFDVSVWELFLPLICGSTMVLAKPKGQHDIAYLARLIAEKSVTICHFVPSVFSHFLQDKSSDQCVSLSRVFTSGEALPYPLVEDFLNRFDSELHNLYGPTEAAVDVTYWKCEKNPGGKVFIGKPVSNTSLYVLDANHNIVPLGEEGELYLGGVQLSRGYLNRKELTEKSFIKNPYGISEADRIYKTGDKVRMQSDGNIEYIGRLDHQIKLRGLRIEIGEIEASILNHNKVKEVAVLVQDLETGDPKLVAYVSSEDKDLSLKVIREFLRKSLPEYMLPNALYVLDELPLTAHGKLDRKNMPWKGDSPAIDDKSRKDEKNSSLIENIETKIAGYFKSALEHGGNIESSEDVFELGATSFTLMQFVQWAKSEFDVDFPVEILLESTQISAMAKYIAENTNSYMEEDKCTSNEINNEEFIEELSDASTSQDGLLPSEGALEAIRVSNVVSDLRTYIENDLNFDGIEDDISLFDAGMTSFTIVQLVNYISNTYNVSLPVEMLLDEPSIQSVARVVSEKLPYNGDTEVAKNIDSNKTEVARKFEGSLDSKFRESTSANQKENKEIRLNLYPLNDELYRSVDTEIHKNKVDFSTLGQFLSPLARITLNDKPKYLYPSGGGKYPVQTYLTVHSDTVNGLDKGAYYYNPENNTLYCTHSGDTLFSEIGSANGETSFCLHFVAEMDAIVPFYSDVSQSLVELDAGYMIGLLSKQQKPNNLCILPSVSFRPEPLRKILKLNSSHQYLVSLQVGCKSPKGVGGQLPGCWSDIVSKEICSTREFRGFDDIDSLDRHPKFSSVPVEEQKEIAREKREIRKMDGNSFVPLRFIKKRRSDYELRSCKRSYLDKKVPFKSISKLLSLVYGNDDQRLYWSSIDYTVELYLFCKTNGVEGIPGGLYRYNKTDHSLSLINDAYDDIDKAITASHVPFNKTHYKLGKFSIFLTLAKNTVSDKSVKNVYQLANFEAGQIGQLLMDYQSEAELGLCPIGALQYHKIREVLGLPEQSILLQNFCGGAVEYSQRLSQPIFSELDSYGSIVKSNVQRGAELAIIGISGKYPDSDSADELWDILSQGRSVILEVPGYRRTSIGRDRWGAYIRDVDCFDNLLFKMSPAEAKLIDPQERQFLQVVWQCLEDAGYTPDKLKESAARIGVFVGCMWNDYGHLSYEGNNEVALSSHSSIANRVSYFFDFSGPSIAIDTSCASALSALHFAKQSIENGECEAAIVGGVNICSHDSHYAVLESMDLLSKDNRSASFSKEGSGWVLGEGVGAMLIRPLDEAEKNLDSIQAVVKASSVTHAGKTSGYGVPNVKRISASLKEFLHRSGVSAHSIRYVESAATGSVISDAAEVNALQEVLSTEDANSTCYIGSIKPNIGHLESASFMSQLNKVILQFQHNKLAPTLIESDINPFINMTGGNVEINTELRPVSDEDFGCVLINAVGALGTIGHVLLEKYTPVSVSEPKGNGVFNEFLVPLSAASQEQLISYAECLRSYLKKHNDDIKLEDVSHTLQVGRCEMKYRVAIVASNTNELISLIGNFLDDSEHDQIHIGNASDDSDVIYNGENITSIGNSWVKGAMVIWPLHSVGKRIQLPGYPFAKSRHWINKNPNEVAPVSTSQPVGVENSDLPAIKSALLKYVLKTFSDISEMPLEDIDHNRELVDYGLNSMLVTRLNQKISQSFPKVPKTVMFECKTLKDLNHFLVSKFEAEALTLLGMSSRSDNSLSSEKVKNDIHVINSISSGEMSARSLAGMNSDLAIVGLAGRFPKADNIEEFWNNLLQAKDCIEKIPEDRWQSEKFGLGSDWGGFINDYDKFDALFFNISPAEAELIDPQERLFLEVAWSAFEDAGYKRDLSTSSRNNIGVFVGAMYSEYQLYGAEQTQRGNSISLSSVLGAIANRVSYVMNLDGPSITIDSLCSSSLTALHLAKNSILSGDCEAALVGGVNLSIHPNKYILHDRMNMSSSHGRCYSFGDGGDGFVPGEGVGAIYIKKYQDALRDGDHIYGIIKGTSVNHDSKTNGFTVPNPIKQGELVQQALKDANISAETISYIEAHGTGTSLGDPIEIAGLCKAFPENGNNQYCAIGSVKSNIGHLESAAGIASIAKVLMQFRDKKLVPSIHSEVLNKNIDFSATPFYVQQSVSDWEQPKQVGESIVLPRRAGISAFGAGGANAHVILEEFSVLEEKKNINVPFIFVLSAKSTDRLKVYLNEWATFINEFEKRILNDELQSRFLSKALYTLQVGREAMGVRLAFAARDYKEFKDLLLQACDDRDDLESRILISNKNIDSNPGRDWLEDDDWEDVIKLFSAKKQYEKLIQIWVSGVDVDWGLLYEETKPGKISIPTYPFLKKRCWLESFKEQKHSQIASLNVEGVHPAIDENASKLFGSCFKKYVNAGDSTWYVDRGLGKNGISPGWLIEMLVASARHSLGDKDLCILPQDVHIDWLDLDTKKSLDLICELYPDSGIQKERDVLPDLIAKISAKSNEANSINLINARFVSESRIGSGERALFSSDMAAVKNGLNKSFDGMIYEVNNGLFLFDPDLWQKIFLEVQNCFEAAYDLPGFVHYFEKVISSGVAEKCVGIICEEEFNCHYLDSEDACFNVTLLNEEGTPISEIRGICVKPVVDVNLDVDESFLGFVVPKKLKKELSVKSSQNNVSGLTLLFESEKFIFKKLKSVSEFSYERLIQVKPGDTYKKASKNSFVINFDGVPGIAGVVEEVGDVSKINLIYKVKDDGNVSLRDFKSYSKSIFDFGKYMSSLDIRVNLAFVIEVNDERDSLYTSVCAFLKSLVKENNKIKSKVVVVERIVNSSLVESQTLESLISREIQEFEEPFKQVVYDCSGHRNVVFYDDVHLDLPEYQFKKNGVYVITGGLQGVGYIVAKSLAAQSDVSLVLTGRRPLSNADNVKMKNLTWSGARVEYVQSDVSIYDDVRKLYHDVRQKYSKVDGIFHCAGVLFDTLLVNSSYDNFDQVLDPKVSGLFNLDECFKDERLDFLVNFSSLTASVGNEGQAAYSFANAFLDRFSSLRNRMVQSGARFGKTISINWPYWQDGGMKIGDSQLKAIKDAAGLVPMRTSQGLSSLRKILSSDYSAISVITGDLVKFSRIERDIYIPQYSEYRKMKQRYPYFASNVKKEGRLVSLSFAEVNDVSLDSEVLILDWVREKVAEIAKIEIGEISDSMLLSELGLDSIQLVKLTSKIKEEYSLNVYPKEIEMYNSIGKLSVYLHGELSDRFMETKNGDLAITENKSDKFGVTEKVLEMTADVVKLDLADISSDIRFSEIGMDSILAMKLINEIQNEFNIRIYPQELQVYDSVKKLSRYLDQELSQSPDKLTKVSEKSEKDEIENGSSYKALSCAPLVKASGNYGNGKYIFLLSTPRAGSTLLRVILQGHNAIFSPPELHLLQYHTMRQWRDDLKKNNREFLQEGIIKAISSAENSSIDSARVKVQDFVEMDAPISEVYQYLQKSSGASFIVDKSPSYAVDLQTLQNAEISTCEPMYIHLIRNPISMMSSFVENRFDKLFSVEGDPWKEAEKLWFNMNQNIRNLLSGIPAERQFMVRYEDIVTQPDLFVPSLCDWLGIAFQQDMLNPYHGDRMQGGLHSGSLPIGDPNFNSHSSIDPTLANAWKKHMHRAKDMNTDTIIMAEEFGYILSEDNVSEELIS